MSLLIGAQDYPDFQWPWEKQALCFCSREIIRTRHRWVSGSNEPLMNKKGPGSNFWAENPPFLQLDSKTPRLARPSPAKSAPSDAASVCLPDGDGGAPRRRRAHAADQQASARRGCAKHGTQKGRGQGCSPKRRNALGI